MVVICPLDLLHMMDAIPLAIVTVVPLSVRVTFAPLVPPPGTFAKTGVVMAKKTPSADAAIAMELVIFKRFAAIYSTFLVFALNNSGDSRR